MTRRAWNRACDDLRLEVFCGLFIGVIGASLEWYRTTTLDWDSLWQGLVLGAFGLLAPVLWFMLLEPGDTHNELVQKVASRDKRVEFARDLQSVLAAIRGVQPIAADQSYLRRSISDIEAQQSLFIKRLRSPESPWSHSPAGWDTVPPGLEIFVWAGLGKVLHLRYPDRIRDPADLYEEQPSGGWKIVPENLNAVRSHSAKMIELVIEEIEHPEGVQKTESPGAFLAVVNIFVHAAITLCKADATKALDGVAASPPESPSPTPIANPRQSSTAGD